MSRHRRTPLYEYVEWHRGDEWYRGEPPDHQEFVSISRLASMIGISRSSAYRLLKDGRLLPPVGRIGKGRRLRFERADVCRWAQNGFPDANRWAQIKASAPDLVRTATRSITGTP